MFEKHTISIPQEPVERYSGFVLIPPQCGVYKGIRKNLDFDWVVAIKIIAKKIKHITMRN